MTKKVSIESKIDALTGIVEKSFAAIADDISKLAPKEEVAAIHTQVNSIERQLRGSKFESRLSDVEEEVFGKARG